LGTGKEIAQVKLRTNVLIAPAAIRLPHLSDVTQTGFTLHWSEPLGLPATGYEVSLQEPGSISDSAFLVENTSKKRLSVSDLMPGTTYVVNIRAANEVGWGDACELEASTLHPAVADPNTAEADASSIFGESPGGHVDQVESNEQADASWNDQFAPSHRVPDEAAKQARKPFTHVLCCPPRTAIV